MNLTTLDCLVVHRFSPELYLFVVFLNLEIVPTVSTQNLLLSSNDLEDLLGDPKDESFLGFGRTVSRIFWYLNY